MAAARDPKGRFAKGSGGRPRGAQNRSTLAAQQLLEGESERLARKAVDLALAGNVDALSLVLRHLLPRRRVVRFMLPALQTASDAPAALAAILRSVADGELAPDEAAALSALIDAYRSAVETAELEQRIAALEAAQGRP